MCFFGLNAISRLKRVAQFSHCLLKDSTASIPSTTFCFFHITKITRVTPKSFQLRHANSKCPMKSTNTFTSYKTQSYFYPNPPPPPTIFSFLLNSLTTIPFANCKYLPRTLPTHTTTQVAPPSRLEYSFSFLQLLI